MADKPDPFDIDALGNAVNDSASRVSTIWISFLIFSLYLLTAASTVTHRQLFLAEAVKLPVLNIDLPLWGFFFLAPILFVIFHIYVLLQVLLLAHTAAAYNSAVERAGFDAEESASLRQRLANTLFAQIFAGSPRESSGWIGWMLKTMAWTTLAIAPVLILVVFLFAFLPYHSHLATWTHRLLILAELLAAFGLWPLVLDPGRDFEWTKLWSKCKRTIALPLTLFGPKHSRYEEWVWFRQQFVPVTLSILLLLVSSLIATFPGEPHVNLLTGHAWSSVQCTRWLQQKFGLVDLRFDRLDMPHVDVIDQDKLEKIEEATEKAGAQSSQSERTRIVRDRDLNCGDFSNFVDMRRIDLTGSRLANAQLQNARLQGASLDGTELRGASLDHAQLQGASLGKANLQGASLVSTQLQGASLITAHLQGASLVDAQLQGATLFDSELQGASLNGAVLMSASIGFTQLQGASLANARMQGATLQSANLQGAALPFAQIQGVDFASANLDHADLSNVSTWRAANANCTAANVRDHSAAAVVDAGFFLFGSFRIPGDPIAATPVQIGEIVARSVAGIPDASPRKSAATLMHAGLDIDPAKDNTEDIAKVWEACEAATHKRSQEKFDAERAALLRHLVCDASENRESIAKGVIRNWIVTAQMPSLLALFGRNTLSTAVSAQLARGLLGLDGKTCAATNDFDKATLDRLRVAAEKVASEPSENLTSGPQRFLTQEPPNTAPPGTIASPPARSDSGAIGQSQPRFLLRRA
jgi:uncharacterized protein YjbI with pentapeptide repeats